MKNQLSRLMNWSSDKVTKATSDTFMLLGITLFMLVFATGCFPIFMPLATSNDNSLTPQQQAEANNRAGVNTAIFAGLIAINASLVAAYLIAVHTRIKEKNSHHQVLPTSQIEWDYLSLVVAEDGLGEIPKTLDGFNKVIIYKRSSNEDIFKNDLYKYRQEYIYRQEAIAGISKSLSVDKTSLDGLINAIRTVCDDACSEDCDSEAFKTFCKCMNAYIRAWLVCSITYNLKMSDGNSLPIDSIFYRDPKNKKQYTKAINDLIERFNWDPLNGYFKSTESIKIIQDYLQELVYLIENKAENQQPSFLDNQSISN